MLLLVLAAQLAHAAPSCDQSAVQTWETFEDYHALGEKTQLLMEAELRTNCGLNGNIYPYYQRAEAGFTFQPLKHLEIRPYYYLTFKNPGAKRTHAIILQITANNFELHRWIISDENRIEEDFQPVQQTTRYTNQLRLARRLRIDGIRAEPYAKGRVTYDLRFRGLAYSRVYVGVEKPLTPKVSLDGYYVRQFGSKLVPGMVNGIGLTVRTSF
ncbi:MAG: DUF2490 domain-containing protein [Candidatus Acidiferrales bacterium]